MEVFCEVGVHGTPLLDRKRLKLGENGVEDDGAGENRENR